MKILSYGQLNYLTNSIWEFIKSNSKDSSSLSNGLLYRLVPKDSWVGSYRSGVKNYYKKDPIVAIKIIILFKYLLEDNVVVEFRPGVKIRLRKNLEYKHLKSYINMSNGYCLNVTANEDATYFVCTEVGIILRLASIFSDLGDYVERLASDQLLVYRELTDSDIKDILSDQFNSDLIKLKYNSLHETDHDSLECAQQ